MQTLSETEFLDVISSTSYKGQLTAEIRGSDWTGQTFSVDIDISQSGQYGDAGQIGNLDLGVDYDAGQGNKGKIAGKMETRFLVGEDGSAPKLFMKFSDIVLPDDFREALDLLESRGEFDLDEIEDTWYLLDYQDLVDSGEISSDELAELNFENALHQDDFQEMYLIFVDGLREYFFTAETSKMVLQMDELLGEEDFKGTPSLKYSVEVNKSNLRAYLKKLRSDLSEAEFMKKLSAADPEFDLTEELFSDKDIDDFVDEFAKLDYEIWVDKGTGVMRNLRITEVDKESSSYGSYFDFGVSLRDNNQVIVVDFSGKAFSTLSCSIEQFSYPIYGDDEEEIGYDYSEQPEECPYLIDEEGNITALKEDSQAFFDYGWSITIDVPESKINHKASFTASGEDFTVEISLEVETVGQGDFEIEAPTDYESLFESFFQGLQEAGRDQARQNDRTYIQAMLVGFYSRNDAWPDVTQLDALLRGDELNSVGLDASHNLNTISGAATIAANASKTIYLVAGQGESASEKQSVRLSSAGQLPDPDSLIIVTGAVCPLFAHYIDGTSFEILADRLNAERNTIALYYVEEGGSSLVCIDNKL